MKSLRTDDIIGAMPRVRHMPKNLYRDHQSYPYRHSVEDSPIKDYESQYKNIGGKWDHSYNQNIYGNFPLSQYDPNPLLEKPTVPNINRTRYNQQRDQTLNRSQQYRESQYQGIYERPRSYKIDEVKNQPQNYPQSQYIQPKQPIFINYDELKHFQNVSKDQNLYHQRKSYQDFTRKPQSPRNNNQISNQNPERNDSNPQTKQQSSIQNNNNAISSVDIGNRSQKSQQNPSSQSLRTSQSKDKVQKNIFRGLGFNIITNSKYLYNVESTFPYSKKEN